MTKSLQCVEVCFNLQDNIAAFSAVAAIRAAARDKLLAMEMHHAIAAFARLDFDFCFINEHAPIITEGFR